MERWHLPPFGRRAIPGTLSPVELREFLSFTDDDLRAIFRRRRRLNRPGLSVIPLPACRRDGCCSQWREGSLCRTRRTGNGSAAASLRLRPAASDESFR